MSEANEKRILRLIRWSLYVAGCSAFTYGVYLTPSGLAGALQAGGTFTAMASGFTFIPSIITSIKAGIK